MVNLNNNLFARSNYGSENYSNHHKQPEVSQASLRTKTKAIPEQPEVSQTSLKTEIPDFADLSGINLTPLPVKPSRKKLTQIVESQEANIKMKEIRKKMKGLGQEKLWPTDHHKKPEVSQALPKTETAISDFADLSGINLTPFTDEQIKGLGRKKLLSTGDLKSISFRHKQQIEDVSGNIEKLTKEATDLTALGKQVSRKKETGISIGRPQANSIKKIQSKQAEINNSLTSAFTFLLNQEEITLSDYEQILVKIQKSKNLTESQKNEISALLQQIRKAKDVIEDQRNKINAAHNGKNERSLFRTLKTLGDIKNLYKDYLQNPEETINWGIGTLEKIRQYALQHPSKLSESMLNNLFLVYEQLNGGEPTVVLFRFQMEKSLVIDALMRGFSTQELKEDDNVPEEIKEWAAMLEILPQVIAAFQGAREGSVLPLISLSLFANEAQIPFAWVLPLLNIGLGAYENWRGVKYIQQAHQFLSVEQRENLVSFMKILEKKYGDIDELKTECLQMRTFHELVSLEQGKVTNIFQRVQASITNFRMKLSAASWKERVVRVIGQVGVPLVVMTAIKIGVIAGFVGMEPRGPLFISACIGAAATIFGGMYTAFQMGVVLSRWINEFPAFAKTGKKVSIMQREIKAKEELLSFLEKNKERIEEMIGAVRRQLAVRVTRGDYDLYLSSSQFEDDFRQSLEVTGGGDGKERDGADRQGIDFRRELFLAKENVAIEKRLKAATLLKYLSDPLKQEYPGLPAKEVENWIVEVTSLSQHFEHIKNLVSAVASTEEVTISNEAISQMIGAQGILGQNVIPSEKFAEGVNYVYNHKRPISDEGASSDSRPSDVGTSSSQH